MKSKTAVRVHGPERKKLEGGQSPPRSTCVHFQSRSGTRACGGGAGRDRTGGLRLAKAALPQLSYSPVVEIRGLVGLSGFEPLTSRLSAVRSNQLSYRPGNNRSESNLKSFAVLVEPAAHQEQSVPQKPGDGTLKTRQARNL